MSCKGLELKQPNGEGALAGDASLTVSEACTMNVNGLCTITIPTKGNSGLNNVHLVKEAGPNVEGEAKIGGITALATGTFCVGISNGKTTSATLKTDMLLKNVGLE